MNPYQQLVDRARKLVLYVANNPVALVAILQAVVANATDQSWKGYGVALLIFLSRYVVTGPLSPPVSTPAPGILPSTKPIPSVKTKVAALAAASVGLMSFSLATASSTTRTAYSGPLTITSCQAISDKIITGDLTIRATNGTRVAADGSVTPCVTLTNIELRGRLLTSYATSSACGGSSSAPKPCGPVLMQDSDVNNNYGNGANIDQTNYKLVNVRERGGRTGAICDGWCYVANSDFADNWFIDGAHMGSFMSNGNGGRPITLVNNTFRCNVAPGSPALSLPESERVGGCSGDLNFFGDFAPIQNVTVIGNTMKASTGQFYYCAYSGANQTAKPYPTGTNLVWRDNIFEPGSNGKCGDAGPLYDWKANAGNIWCGNTGAAGLPAEVGCGTTSSTTTSTTRATTTTTIPPSTTTATVPVTTTSTTPTTTTAPTTFSTSTTSTTVAPSFTITVTCTIDATTHAVLHCP